MAEKGFSPPHKKEETEDWLMSYADMITLLMAFFVLLISMSHIDPVKYEQVQGGMAKDIGKRETEHPIQQLRADINKAMQGLKIDDTKVDIGNDDRGLVLQLDAGTLFDPASAKLKEELLPALTKMAEMLDSDRYSAFQVEVDGHTDDTPVSTPAFPSNWELSAARATTVVRYFIQQGVAPTRLSAVGLADTQPRVTNRDANGNPLPANQAINRRVSIHIVPR
jgi:chemotaxis protein MotB